MCRPGAHLGGQSSLPGSDDRNISQGLRSVRWEITLQEPLFRFGSPNEQTVVILLQGLVPVFRIFSSRPITFWCRKMLPMGAIILGWEFFPANSEFCRCHEGFNPGTLKARSHICQLTCVLLKPRGY